MRACLTLGWAPIPRLREAVTTDRQTDSPSLLSVPPTLPPKGAPGRLEEAKLQTNKNAAVEGRSSCPYVRTYVGVQRALARNALGSAATEPSSKTGSARSVGAIVVP